VLFPSLFLIFLIPVWGVLTPILQSISTYAVTFIMGYTGIPTYVEGNFISIPPGVFEIAGGCSGLRYLLVSLAISSLFIFLNIKKTSHGALFLFIAIIGALITNWLRITGLILIGYYTNMESSLMADHNTFGWYLYIPFMVGLFYFGQRFITSLESKVTNSNQNTNNLMPLLLVLPLVLVIASSFFAKNIMSSKPINDISHCETVPLSIPLPALHNQYDVCAIIDGSKITLIYTYHAQELEDSVDFYLNEFTPKDWNVINKEQTPFWNTLKVQKRNVHYDIAYQFQAHHAKTSNLILLKRLKLKNSIRGLTGTKLIWQLQERHK
jgi:exosortase/archaeosortase family protein